MDMNRITTRAFHIPMATDGRVAGLAKQMDRGHTTTMNIILTIELKRYKKLKLEGYGGGPYEVIVGAKTGRPVHRIASLPHVLALVLDRAVKDCGMSKGMTAAWMIENFLERNNRIAEGLTPTGGPDIVRAYRDGAHEDREGHGDCDFGLGPRTA